MKKITFVLVVFFITININSQTLTYAPTWPSATWSITGDYSAGNLLLNPTTSVSSFKFNDGMVAHTGDAIFLESPEIDLRAAFTAKETALKISLNIAFATTAQTPETIGLQYYDADDATWKNMPQASPQSGEMAGDYINCVTGAIDLYFDFKLFTTNQQQHFKFRFYYNDGGLSQGKGICMSAPMVTSIGGCTAPTSLSTSNLGYDSVSIGWIAHNSETQWEVEYGAQNFTLGTGISQQTNQNPNRITGLSQQTSYDVYVRADCKTVNSGGEFYSDWSSKLNFTTTSSCEAVSGFTAPSITSNSISVKWASTGNESSWTVEVGKTGYTRGVDSFFNVIANSPSTTMYGLSPDTTYDFYIQVNCGNENYSTWVGPFTYTTSAATSSIGWANLQYPGTGTINLGENFTVYAQVYINGITNSQGQGSGVRAWIGYSTADTNPNTWTNWVEASYNIDNGNNDEYMANIGAIIPVDGNYYYASRFQYGQGDYSYGGFSLGTGNFWDGSGYVSGQLTINRTFSKWSTQTSPLGSQILGKVQFVSSTEGWITAGNGQLLHTLDAGTNWSVVDPTPSETDWILSNPAGAMFWLNQTHGWVISTLGTEFANSMGAVLHYTTDGGANWTSKVISNVAHVVGVQVQFFDADNGWLSTYNTMGMNSDIYTSSDGGANWTLVSTGTGGGLLYFLDANNGWRIMTTGGSAPYTIEHSTDGGNNWTLQYTDNNSGNYNAMFFIDANNGWVVGDNDKILKTSDGGANWIPINNTGLPIGGNNFKALFFNNVNVGRIAAGGDDNRNSSILYTADGGTTWEIQPLALAPSVGKSNNGSASKTQVNNDTADILSIYFVDQLNGWYVAENGQIVHTTGDPLSVQQNNLSAIEGFSFYPNPVQDYLNLNANQKIDQVEVYNLLGQQLLQVKPNLSTYQLKLNNIKSGLYFIKVQTAGKTGTFKILKQ